MLDQLQALGLQKKGMKAEKKESEGYLAYYLLGPQHAGQKTEPLPEAACLLNGRCYLMERLEVTEECQGQKGDISWILQSLRGRVK